MANLPTQQVTLAGLAPQFVAAAGGGDKLAPGDRTCLHVKNASGAPITVTVDSVRQSDYGQDSNVVVTVPATTGDRMVGPFPAQRFAGTDGKVAVTYSGVTSLTVAAVRI